MQSDYDYAEFRNYTPHANARKLHKSTALEIRLDAAARSGKTMSLRYDIITSAWNNPYPNYCTLVCAPEYPQLSETLEKPINSLLSSLGLLATKNESLHYAILRNGRKIVYRSLENYHSIFGLDVHKAYVDEAYLWSVKREAIETVRARLILTNGTLILAGTPKGTSSWQYHEFFSSDSKRPDRTEYLHYDIRDNPVITEEAIDRMKSSLDPLYVRQEVYGEWVNLTENSVYHAFDYSRNVKEFAEDLAYQLHPMHYIGVDYNIGINAWVGLFLNPKTRDIYVFAEGEGARTTQALGHELKAKFKDTELFIIDDASGNQRQQGDGFTNREILNQQGFWKITEHGANPPRVARYACLNAHFCNGLGNAHLFIHPTCKRLISELETLSYKPNSDKPDDLGGKAGHITDALGYAVYYLSGGQAAWEPKEQIHYARVIS